MLKKILENWRSLRKKNVYRTPDYYINAIISVINIPYKFIDKIKNSSLKILKFQSHNPIIIATTLIYVFCCENNIKINLIDICNIFGISKTSVIRFKKKIGEMCTKNTFFAQKRVEKLPLF